MIDLQCCVCFSRQQRESGNTYIPSLLRLLLTPQIPTTSDLSIVTKHQAELRVLFQKAASC